MKKKIWILIINLFLISSVWAQNDKIVQINDVTFEIPSKYQGETINGKYSLDDIFSIRCIDGNIPKSIGLWACEMNYSKNLIISDHQIRHYCQYNSYVNDNQSHAYFASGDSIYEIIWIGNEITPDINDMIKNAPKSNINRDTFKNILDKSIETYQKERIEQLNKYGEYNYLESKYNSQISNGKQDNTQLKEILLRHYN